MNLRATFLPLADRLYDISTIKRTCSFQSSPDLFDGKPYSIDAFYKMTSAFFDKPELFYKTFNAPDENDIIKVNNDVNNNNFYSYPSPVKSEWPENNKAFFKLFSNNKPAGTLLLFVPGW